MYNTTLKACFNNEFPNYSIQILHFSFGLIFRFSLHFLVLGDLTVQRSSLSWHFHPVSLYSSS